MWRRRHSTITARILYHVPDGTPTRGGVGRPAVGSVAGRHELSSAPWCVVPGGGLDACGSEAGRQPGADPRAARVPENRLRAAPALDDRRPPARCEKPACAMGRQVRRVPRLPQPHGAEGRAAHDALRPLRVPVSRRLGGVVHRGGLSGDNAVEPISSLSTVEGARPAVLETLRTGMIQSRLLRRLGLLAALAAGYFVAGKLALRVAYVHPSATAVVPPTGLTLAALLLAGYDVWPAILLGAFLVNITTAGSVATSAAIAVGNTLEGLAGAYLVNRFARGDRACERARDVFKLAGLAALGSTAVSATTGVTALSLAGFAAWTDFGSIWSTWWMGDAVSDLVVAPALLLWAARPRVRWTRRQALEAAALLAGIAVVGIAVFDGHVPWKDKHYPLEFLCVPLLLWSAFRFDL